jgi:hypothetical protein
MTSHPTRLTFVFALCVAALLSSPALAAPPDPLTLTWAHTPPSPTDCDAFTAAPPFSLSSYQVNAYDRLLSLLEAYDYEQTYPDADDSPVERVAAITHDRAALLPCKRDADAYFIYGASERYLARLSPEATSPARALAAFDIALALCDGCADPEKYPNCPTLLAHRAGALADLGRFDDAFKSLEGALAAGFLPIRWLSNDLALASLRKHPEWEARFNASLPSHLKLPDKPTFDLSLYFGAYRAGTSYIFCQDHRAFTSYFDGDPMGRDLPPTWTSGHWELKPDGLWVTFSNRSPERFLSTAEARVFFSSDEYTEDEFSSSISREAHLCKAQPQKKPPSKKKPSPK